MLALAPGQTRRLGIVTFGTSAARRVRAATLGLFFSACATAGCVRQTHTGEIRGAEQSAAEGAVTATTLAATENDRRYETGLFTWLAEHAPSAVVAWRIDPARVREVDPGARVIPARPHPCEQALHERAALAVLFGRDPAGRVRDSALDCGFALFRDRAGAAIAPR